MAALGVEAGQVRATAWVDNGPRVPDLPAFERFHADQLAALHNVAQFVTYISMTDFSDL